MVFFFFCQTGPIMWVHMPASPSCVITPYYDLLLQLPWKARRVSIQTFGKFPDKIALPYDKYQLLHLQQHDDWNLYLLTLMQ